MDRKSYFVCVPREGSHITTIEKDPPAVFQRHHHQHHHQHSTTAIDISSNTANTHKQTSAATRSNTRQHLPPTARSGTADFFSAAGSKNFRHTHARKRRRLQNKNGLSKRRAHFLCGQQQLILNRPVPTRA